MSIKAERMETISAYKAQKKAERQQAFIELFSKALQQENKDEQEKEETEISVARAEAEARTREKYKANHEDDDVEVYREFAKNLFRKKEK